MSYALLSTSPAHGIPNACNMQRHPCETKACQYLEREPTYAVMAEACGALSFSGGRSDYRMSVSQNICKSCTAAPYLVEYDPNHKTAARAARNVLAIAHVRYRNLEAVATGTRVVIYLERLVVEAVFDLYLIVEVEVFVSHGGRA